MSDFLEKFIYEPNLLDPHGQPADLVTIDKSDSINDDLIGRWVFNRGVGRLIDVSGLNNHGVKEGAPSLVTSGRWGQGIKFDAGTERYIIPQSDKLATPTTLTMWFAFIKRGNARVDYFLVSPTAGSSRYICVYTDNKIRVRFSGLSASSGYSGNTSVSNGELNVGGVTYDGAAIKIYLNGKLDRTIAATGTFGLPDTSAKIGGTTSLDHFIGEIYSGGFAKRAYTASEMRRVSVDIYAGLKSRSIGVPVGVAAAPPVSQPLTAFLPPMQHCIRTPIQ